MTIIRKLRNHPYANCKIFETEIKDPDNGMVIMRRWLSVYVSGRKTFI